jgi:subtilisin-like proprotein convertase family protein
MGRISAALGTFLSAGRRTRKETNRGARCCGNGPLSFHCLRVEPLEERALLSVSTGTDDTVVYSSSMAKSVATAAAFHVAPSVEHANSQGQISINLRPGDYSLQSLSTGEVALSASGLDAVGTGGSPQLAGKLLRIALPIDADLSSVTLTVSAGTSTSVPGSYRLNAVAVAVADTAEGMIYATNGLDLVDGKDQNVYAKNAVYDSQCCTLVDVQQMGRWKIAEVMYSPFEYNPVTGSLSVVEDANIVLTYETDSPLSASIASKTTWDSDAASLLVNYGDTSLGSAAAAAADQPAASDTTASYVIITTSAIQTNSTKLADFVTHKQALGFTVLVATESTWGGGTGDAAAENIRNWLKNNYASLGIQYVLLVGNPNPSSGDVPMKECYTVYNSSSDYLDAPTDYYYGDLTSNWDTDADGLYGEYAADLGSTKPLPEVTVGRIPVYNAAYSTLDSILTKTINYESESDIAWRENILLPMAVLNYANEDGGNVPATDGVALAQHIQNDIATPNGYGTYTMFEQAGLDPVTTTCNAALTKANLISAWTASTYGIVDWQGHGNSTGAYRKYWAADSDSDGIPDGSEMSGPDFMSSGDVSSLNNGRPSVVMQVSCTNGEPETSTNLGYSLLKNGAIGTYSGTRVTWYFYGGFGPSMNSDNASFAYYLTRQLVQNTSTSLGGSLEWCRENLTCGDAGLWQNTLDFNLYGDPSVTPFKVVVPTKITGTVYRDVDNDGVRDTGELGTSGVTVFIDDNNNGSLDTATTTVASGTLNTTIPNLTTKTFPLTVSNMAGVVSDVNVTLSITHTYDADMDVYLISPTGTRVELFTDVGSSGDNFTNTTLDDQAGTAIAPSSAPFSGSYRPEGLLSALNGQVANGTWTLEITDDQGGTTHPTGKLVSWSISISSQERSVTTNSSGDYVMGVATGGTYTIREVVPTGKTQTAPAAGYYSVTIAVNQTVTGKDFGNWSVDTTPPTVTGVPNDGTDGEDIDIQTSTTTLSANWAGVFADLDGVITGYEWAIGSTPGGINIMSFTSVGVATSQTKTGLSLVVGSTYYVTVRATNGSGLQATATSDGVYIRAIDTTGPTITGLPNDGVGTDVDYQSATNSFSANWAGVFADPESGISTYYWAIGSTPGGYNIQGYTSVGTATSATKTGLSLVSGRTYYVSIRALNGVGLNATAISDGITVDTSAPTITGLPGDGLAGDLDVQTSLTALSANWASLFADPQSGIVRYEWAIGTTVGGANVQAYTDVGVATSASNSSLSLTPGTTYYISVRATNGAGAQSTATSDGITVINNVRTWDGGGADNNWTTAANWANDIAPVAGDVLVFAGTTRTSTVNDFDAGTVFDSIVFNSGGFVLSGNGVKLTPSAGVAVDNVTGQNQVALAVVTDSTGATIVRAGSLQLGLNSQSLVLTGAGADIRGGSLVLDYSGGASPAETVNMLATYSYDAGEWDRGQFQSSTLAAGLTLGWCDASSKITIKAAYAGDFNLDGTVDNSDLNVWKANIGNETAFWQQGDASYDGCVDGFDLDLFKANLGKTLSSDSGVTSLPGSTTPSTPIDLPVTEPTTTPTTTTPPSTPVVSPPVVAPVVNPRPTAPIAKIPPTWYPTATLPAKPVQGTTTPAPVANVRPLPAKPLTALPLVQPSKVESAVTSLASLSQSPAALQAAHDAVFGQISSMPAPTLATPLKPTLTRA